MHNRPLDCYITPLTRYSAVILQDRSRIEVQGKPAVVFIQQEH